MDITSPEIIQQESANLQIVVWLGSIIISMLIAALTALWRENRKQGDYIKEQDKANILLLTEMGHFMRSLGIDVSKIDNLLTGNISNNITEIKMILNSIDKQINKL
jgi:hypothetical protein